MIGSIIAKTMTLPKELARSIALIPISSSGEQITSSHIDEIEYMCAVITGPSSSDAEVVSLLQICIIESSDFHGLGIMQPTPHMETIGLFSEHHQAANRLFKHFNSKRYLCGQPFATDGLAKLVSKRSSAMAACSQQPNASGLRVIGSDISIDGSGDDRLRPIW
jgi:hypothetical protein